jgi:hypothetical protein
MHGDRLWVKETHRINTTLAGYRVTYRADDAERMIDPGKQEQRMLDDNHWRPSIFMRRWMSRLVLEITDVRIERLNDISDDDAKAEGVDPLTDACIAARVAGPPETPHRLEYYALWESINGKRSWERNPWVWVVEFRRVAA